MQEGSNFCRSPLIVRRASVPPPNKVNGCIAVHRASRIVNNYRWDFSGDYETTIAALNDTHRWRVSQGANSGDPFDTTTYVAGTRHVYILGLLASTGLRMWDYLINGVSGVFI